MIAAPPSVVVFVESCSWEVLQSYPFGQTSHINLQEIRALRALIRRLIRVSPGPSRIVVAVDSQVTLGAVAKGRSSSFQINGLLRSLLGLLILGNKRVHLLWVPSKSNPADYPSRFVGLPSEYSHTCPNLQGVLRRLRRMSPASSSSAGPIHCHLRSGSQCFVEAFAGSGHLSAAMRAAGFRVDEPLEAYPRVGVHVACRDLLNPQVLRTLHTRILSGDIGYMHFGLRAKPGGRWHG